MKVKISPLVYILAAYVILIGRIVDLTATAAAMLVHELAHAAVAKKLGYKISSIKLMPYGLSLVGAFESASCRDECLIALAGPVASALSAIAFFLCGLLFPVTTVFVAPVLSASLALVVFNVLPVYPLDGGRVALALLARKIGRSAAYRKLRVIGFILGIAFTLLFIVSCFFTANVSYASMGGFMLLSAVFPDASCSYECAFVLSSRRRKLKKGLCVRRVMVSQNAPVSALIKWLNHGYVTEFVVVGDSEEQLFTLTERELERVSGSQMYENVGFLRKNGKIV